MHLGTQRVWLPVAIAILLSLLVVTGFYQQSWRLLYNVTESMPTGWYLLERESPRAEWLLPGTSVAYHPVIPNWARLRYNYKPEHTFVKAIGAVPGEVLHTEGRHVFACPTVTAAQDPRKPDCRELGEVLEEDSKGRPMPFEHPWKAHIIPEGYYYLYAGRRPGSFDSRYQGLIPQERILGRIIYLHWD